jgi:ABC-type transporter MlaC component
MLNEGTNASVGAPQNQEAPSASSNEAPVNTESLAVSTQSTQPTTEVKHEVPAEEKVLTQTEVNKIVAREKREAREKALQEIEQKSLSVMQNHQNQINSGQIDGNKPLTFNDIVKIQQENAQKAQEAFVAEVQNTFVQKLDSFKNEDPNFVKEVLANIPADINLAVVQGLNGLDNAADVLREMANHPVKYENIQVAARNNPQWGLRELYKLSNSIKANKEALKQPKAEPPLSQIKQSPTGKDSGKLTIQELRRLPQYRV